MKYYKIFHRPKTFLAQHKQTTEELGVTNEEDTYEVRCPFCQF